MKPAIEAPSAHKGCPVACYELLTACLQHPGGFACLLVVFSETGRVMFGETA
jgi:hypothetical protein